jgi:hypothetical protein
VSRLARAYISDPQPPFPGSLFRALLDNDVARKYPKRAVRA